MKKTLLASVLTLLATQSLFADHHEAFPSWNNVELNYVSVDFDDIDNFNPKGLSLKASHLLNENLFVIGEYVYIEEEFLGVDISQNNYSVGIGSQSMFNDNINMYGVLAYERYDIEDISEDGFELTAGMRYFANEHFEVDTNLSLLVIDDEEELAFKVKGYYKVKEDLSLGLGYTVFEDDGGMLEAGIRYSF